MNRRRFLVTGTAAGAFCALIGPGSDARAQANYPERPVTIIVPFAAGGSTDIMGRLLATELRPILGQNLVVDNRPGANATIGVAAVARAAPDGYTLLVTTSSALSNPALGPVPYDFQKDFVPVAYLGSAPIVVLAGPKSGLNTFQDVVARAKAEPGKLTYGSPGHGGIGHLAGELLSLRLGIRMVHVPYAGQGPVMNAVMGGHIDLGMTMISTVAPQVLSGAARALVQTSPEPWPALPDVPSVRALGIENAEVDVSQMLLAPAGTPQAIVDRLEKEVLAVLARPEIKERMLKVGFAVRPLGAQDLRKRIDTELALWKDLVAKADIKSK
jgi:tripartite-type tricarboxylate transporter receptor subunit TctC